MIKATVLIVLLSCVFASQTCDQPNIAIQDVFNGQEPEQSLQDYIKAVHCLEDSYAEVMALINLGKDIAAGNVIGDVVQAYKIIDNGIKMLQECDSLFCYGPSFDKCQAANPGNECEKTGLIVYPKCSEGYTNWLCCVCATECPAGFRDDGLYCAKPAAYGRGAGYALWDEQKCFDQNSQGCEKNGAMWYPKCADGFHAVGCCVCSPNCPSGWEDIGVSCKKPASYGRGVGYPVSFGLQCLRENAAEKFEAACDEQTSYVGMLAESSLQQYMATVENENDVNLAFPDTFKNLAQFSQKFVDGCQPVENLQ